MQQSQASFQSSIYNTYASQSPSNKFKFKQKIRQLSTIFQSNLISFFNENNNTLTQTKILQHASQLRAIVESIQEKAQLMNVPEFDNYNGVGISIYSYYNNKFNSIGSEETEEQFNNRLMEIKEYIKRRLPFIKVVHQIIFDIQAQSKYPNHQLHIQLFLDGQQFVLYQKDVADENLPQPNGKIITEAICLYLKKFNLTVQVDCDAKDVQPVCEQNVNNKNILEGLKVTIRQKEGVMSAQSPTKQIVIKTSFNEKSMFKSTTGDKNDVRVFFSPTKTMFQSTTTLVQSDMKTKQQEGKSKSTHSRPKIPVKMFAQSVLTNYLEEAKFVDLISMINQYEIDINGENIKQSKTMLNVEDILDKSSTEQAVIVTTRVERTDIQKCYIKVKVSGEYTKDAIIKIQKEQSECNDGYDIITDYDDKLDAYYFWGKVQNMYYLEISKKDCFPQTKNVFLQGQNNHVIEFTLINCVETMLKFQAFNIVDKTQFIEGVQLEILQSDQNETETVMGKTDNSGGFSCQGLMFKQIHIQAKKKGFLNVTYDFDVKANSTGSLLNIPMIPDYFSLINQYHILIYIPNKSDFQMNYYLKCPDGTIINTANKQHKSLKVKLETVRLSKQSCLMNFQVHVQSLDPFISQNKYGFFVENQKSQRILLCQSQSDKKPQLHVSNTFAKENLVSKQEKPKNRESGLSPLMTKSVYNINEIYLKTRVQQNDIQSPKKKEQDLVAQKIQNYCAEDSIRIFITYGHQVVETMMIQTNLLLTNQKCYGVIDLDLRKFYHEEECYEPDMYRSVQKIPSLKKDSMIVQSDDRRLTSILSQITNQRFK